MDSSISIQWLTARAVRPVVSIALALALLAALAPAGAEATKRVKSGIVADVNGIIDRHASVSYFYFGEVGAGFLNYRCMAGRRVVLFRVESNGTETRVRSTRTDFLGDFFAPLERPVDEIAGNYYARVKRRTRKVWHSKETLICLPARTPTFLVEVPASLL